MKNAPTTAAKRAPRGVTFIMSSRAYLSRPARRSDRSVLRQVRARCLPRAGPRG
jgi:hypothetical protein